MWDFRGNLLKQKDSLGGTWKYAYDLTGRLTSATNPVEKTGFHGVDIQNILRGEFSRTDPELRSLYTYDAQGNLVEASENGTDYHYTHDTEGRVLSKRAWGKKLYENHYDACGRLRELITGEQKTSYGYDKAGRLAEVCASNGIRAQYRYDKNDMQTEVLYGNGLRTSYTYDERSQLTGMESVLKDGRILHKASYSYDNAGNRITRDEQYTSLQMRHDTTCYTYDSMERLTKESLNGAVTSYGYDLAGNRITKSTDGRTEKYFYNNRNQLTELHREKDVVRYSYDPAGNLAEENYLTADGASTKKLHYVYDVYNRNVSVTGDDFTQKNHYDAEGYRDSITEQDKVTNFVYQGGMLLHELDEDKNPARHYVLGNEYIGLDHNYYLTDEQGSVRYVLDAAGNVQNDYQYDAFGQRIAGHENIPNRLRYNAQIEDDLTGLYYLRARYYNTGIGRFTQEDVIYNDGLNLYAYCSSNPVMYSDPSGFTKQCDPKVGGEKDSKSGGNSSITNDILECQRKGSALKVDEIKPITQINPKTRRPEIIKEFPATAQSHGFNDLIDNYAGYATKSLIRNGTLYQLKGTLNGVQGRFEWIIQDGYVTHRMFVRDGTMNGVPIKP